MSSSRRAGTHVYDQGTSSRSAGTHVYAADTSRGDADTRSILEDRSSTKANTRLLIFEVLIMAEYSGKQLAKLLDVTPETLRRYVREGIIPRPERRNEYGDLHLEQGRFVRDLVYDHSHSFADVREMLAERAAEQRAAATRAAAQAKVEQASKLAELGLRKWERAELVPGLELHIVEGASPLVRRIAEDLVRQFSLAMPSSQTG